MTDIGTDLIWYLEGSDEGQWLTHCASPMSGYHGAKAPMYTAQRALVLRRGNTMVAMIARTLTSTAQGRSRSERLWWAHTPQKCAEQLATDIVSAADALSARGVPRPPVELVHELVSWTMGAPV